MLNVAEMGLKANVECCTRRSNNEGVYASGATSLWAAESALLHQMEEWSRQHAFTDRGKSRDAAGSRPG
jgi:hypothetical protein